MIIMKCTENGVSTPLSIRRKPDYQRYNQLKQSLNPDLTPREYTAACQKIAKRRGV